MKPLQWALTIVVTGALLVYLFGSGTGSIEMASSDQTAGVTQQVERAGAAVNRFLRNTLYLLLVSASILGLYVWAGRGLGNPLHRVRNSLADKLPPTEQDRPETTPREGEGR